MPEALHRKLMNEAAKRGMKGKKKNAYVYGTLDKIAKKTGKAY